MNNSGSRQAYILFLLAVVLFTGPYILNAFNRQNKISAKTDYTLCWHSDKLLFGNDINCLWETNDQYPAVYSGVLFQKIPLNRADYQLLLSVPGVGPVTASQILRYRNRVKVIRNFSELGNIRGIGDKKITKLRNHVTLK